MQACGTSAAHHVVWPPAQAQSPSTIRYPPMPSSPSPTPCSISSPRQGHAEGRAPQIDHVLHGLGRTRVSTNPQAAASLSAEAEKKTKRPEYPPEPASGTRTLASAPGAAADGAKSRGRWREHRRRWGRGAGSRGHVCPTAGGGVSCRSLHRVLPLWARCLVVSGAAPSPGQQRSRWMDVGQVHQWP